MDSRYIIGLLAVIFMAWFAIGVIYNLRRGETVLRWMRNGGLPKLGEKTTFRWLGSSIAEMVIERARSPYRRVETLVVLAPRDLFWMMLWAWLRGRHDTLIFRCTLYAAPRAAFTIADPRSWTGRDAVNRALREGWETRAIPWSGAPAPASNSLSLLAPQGLVDRAQELLPSYAAVLDRLGARPWLFSLRRDTPLLELHLPFPNTRQVDAANYFETLRELAKVVMDVKD